MRFVTSNSWYLTVNKNCSTLYMHWLEPIGFYAMHWIEMNVTSANEPKPKIEYNSVYTSMCVQQRLDNNLIVRCAIILFSLYKSITRQYHILRMARAW